MQTNELIYVRKHFTFSIQICSSIRLSKYIQRKWDSVYYWHLSHERLTTHPHSDKICNLDLRLMQLHACYIINTLRFN